MKVVLPDGKELELADGATGLDAARAIGPKLAEQAVLVRTNGHVQDVRLPLADGAADPVPDDARHGRPGRALRPAPLERAPARRGGPPALPRREDRDRPADRAGVLLRLRVPRADHRGRPRADRGGGPPRARRRGATGAARRRPRRGEGALRPRRAVQGRARRHRRGRDQPLHRRATSPISAAGRTCRTRSRSRRSSSPASPAPTGAATSTTRSSRASTAPPSTRRRTSTRT